MPTGIPVATVGLDGARNAGILAAQILAAGDPDLATKIISFKEGLKNKIIEANSELKSIKFKFKTN